MAPKSARSRRAKSSLVDVPLTTPILIYVPGLGRSRDNTADGVAAVIASELDLGVAGADSSAVRSTGVLAPTGLTVGDTILDSGGKPVLQLFQFDYQTHLDAAAKMFAPSTGPGLVRASYFAVGAWLKVVRAWNRPAKSTGTKLQLFLGLLLASALVFAAVVSLVGLLAAIGVPVGWLETGVDKVGDLLDSALGAVFNVINRIGVPTGRFEAWLDSVVEKAGDVLDSPITLPAALGIGTLSWVAFRDEVLGMASLTQTMMRFVDSNDDLSGRIAKHLDLVVDDLRDAGWTGDIHLLGYSFGSLVLFDAMLPRSARQAEPAKQVKTITTIGCPLDLVRLYYPDYDDGNRVALNPDLQWVNVFNKADVLASNVVDDDDVGSGTTERPTLSFGGITPTSKPWGNDKMSWYRVVVSGRTHAKYWGSVGDPNCFHLITGVWVEPVV